MLLQTTRPRGPQGGETRGREPVPNLLGQRRQQRLDHGRVQQLDHDQLRGEGRVSRQGRKFLSCSHCQKLGQQASWLLIGSTRVNTE